MNGTALPATHSAFTGLWWKRLIAAVVGFLVVLSGLSIPPAAQATPQPGAAAPAPPVADPQGSDGDQPAAEQPGPSDGESTSEPPSGSGDGYMSLLDGLGDIPVGPASGPAADGSVADESAGDPGAGEQSPAGAQGVDPQVRTTLEESEDGTVPVIVELAERPDLDAIEVRADRAAMEAAREQRASARGPSGAELTAQAEEAAETARASTVLQTLQANGKAERADLVEQLQAGRGARAAGQESKVRELWITNAVAATVDEPTLAELAADPDVGAVTLDGAITVPEVTSEPKLPTWGLEKVGAPQTWGEYDHRGEGVTVAVLDTGVDATHPALADSYRGRDGDHSDSWYVSTGENYPTPGDGNGHGTHVTGTIAGGPPGEVVGVAPDAEWIGVKLLSDGGSGSFSGILDGMQWILAPGGDPAKAPDIANNSWGAANAGDTSFWDAVAAWRSAGIVPVFANGNTGPAGRTVGSPASYPHSFGVGATDSEDNIAPFSSRGPATWNGEDIIKPQVSAPGDGIYSAWPTDSGQSYHTISGTSMATPHVSGVAALALSARPDLGVDEMEDLLTETARTGDHMGQLPNNNYGHGIVDAYEATSRAAHSGQVTGSVSGPDGPVAATLTVADEDASTDADPETGLYELFLPSGTHEVVVEAYGYASTTLTVEVADRQTLTRDITLEEAATSDLTGSVTSGGDPVAGAQVSILGAGLEPAITGDDGTFSLEVAHGTHTVRAARSGHLPLTQEVTVDGDTSLTLDLTALDQSAAPGWPEYQNNGSRAGFSDQTVVPESLQQEWEVDLGGVAIFNGVIVSGGTAYLTTENGELHALDAETGESRWTFTGGSMLRSTPAGTEEHVYLGGGNDTTLYALDPATGEVDWTYDTGDELLVYSTPTVVDGIVYVSTGLGAGNGGFVHAVDAATGERIWRGEVGPQIFFGPTVAEGTVVAASREDHTVRAFDAATGEVRWTHQDDNTFLSMPAIADGTVYLGTSSPDFTSGSVLALDLATGDELWEATGHGDTQGNSPVVYGDLVVLGSHSHASVSAYDRATGEQVWTHGVGAPVTIAQAVTASGVVFGGSQDSRAWALDASTGELLWEQGRDASVLTAPAVADGMVYIADNDGVLTAFSSTGSVSGTVSGPDGGVAAEVTVTGTGESVTTDADGSYTLSHRPGTYTLEVFAYGYGREQAEVEIDPEVPATADFTLTPVGQGTLAGTVTDAGTDTGGTALSGVTVSLPETGLDPVTTGDDGAFTFGEVSSGTYQLTAEYDGYAPQTVEVTVTDGEPTGVDVTLERYDLAVVADYEGEVTDLLSAQGWLVESVSFAEIDGSVEAYTALVLAGTGDDRADADPERMQRIVADADAAGTSIVALDQWALSYGSVDTLLEATGDPGTVETEYYSSGRIWLEDVQPHPITDGVDEERVQLLDSGSHFGWLEGYSGLSLATLGSDAEGYHGAGIGLERRSLEHAHILLPSHAPTPWDGPSSTWEPAMSTLLVDAVEHAIDGEYGAVAGAVTDESGDPVEAEVSVVDGPEAVTATGDGYELLLDPGEYTLRVSAIGYVTEEHDVTVVAGETVDLDAELADSGLGTLAGTVSSGGTGVEGATVTLAGTELSTTTDADGEYVLDGAAGGTYTVEVTADGYLPLTRDDVEVADGETTTLDLELESAPSVVVLGDRQGILTGFLNDRSIPTTEADWSVTEDLADVDVAIVQDPSDIPPEEFRQRLAAFDDAGVSLIWPATNFSSYSNGIHLLSEYTGVPETINRMGGFNGEQIELHDLADHPIFAGIDSDPVWVFNAEAEGPWFGGYSGIPLAQVAEAGSDPAGVGLSYEPRTTESVDLFMSGFAASFRNGPDTWTPEAEQIFVNAVRWADAPRLGGFEGQVTDPDGEPVPDVTVSVDGERWAETTDANGQFALGVPAGEYPLTYEAFGYQTASQTLTVGESGTTDASLTLQVGDVGGVTGVVRSSGDGVGSSDASSGAAAQVGEPLEGVAVGVQGTPLTTTTDAEGRYTFDRLEAGTHTLELETDGHVRRLVEVTVPSGETVTQDVVLSAAPQVGVIDDYRGYAADFLTEWGYEAQGVEWGQLDEIAELDVVVANHSTYNNPGPGEEGFRAFLDVVNRNAIPVVWAAQDQRGAIQYLHGFQQDPATVGEGSNDGDVSATVVEDHPLTAGLPEQFPITTDDHYAWFDDFSGTSVASLSVDGQEVGDTMAFTGRTAGTVDVLLSTMSVSAWGYPASESTDGRYWTEDTQRAYTNALQWALESDGLGAEVRGTVVNADGQGLASTVTVAETGQTFTGRAGDGTFLAALDPGTWTLEVSAFGHLPETYEVTLEAGESDQPTLTLEAEDVGTIAGTVTDEAGTVIADATVSVVGTPLTATTDADGSYAIPGVPSGDVQVEFTADGYFATRVPVTVTSGETSTADVSLTVADEVAVLGDYQSSLTGLLEDEHYVVQEYAQAELDLLTTEVAEHDLIVLNRIAWSTTAEELQDFITAAAEADTSVMFSGNYSTTGTVWHLADKLGDPESVDSSFVPEEIGYTIDEAHPIFDGYEVGETVTLLRHPGANQQYLSFSGYSGTTIGDVVAPLTGEGLGDGMAYRFASPQSVHVLTGSLGAGTHGAPGDRWTDDAETIFLNTVAWAGEATQASITGTVTSEGEDGQPVAGATVAVTSAGASTTTADDGTYSIGVPPGEHTVEVSAPGYETATESVTVGDDGAVVLDVPLVPAERASVTVSVTESGPSGPDGSGDPVVGAEVTLTGPTEASATTGDDGLVEFTDVLTGSYTITVEADGFTSAEVTQEVVAGEQQVQASLAPIDTAVVGDVDAAMTAFLLDADVAAEGTQGDGPAGAIDDYEVVAVNGGEPSEDEFDAVVSAADDSEVSLVFTGTYGVGEGGVRLLEAHSDDVAVGGQGYGDGPVGLTGFDADHPLFSGLGDPAAIVADDGYYSWLESSAGEPLATLTVDGAQTGTAVASDFRSGEHLHLLVSMGAVSDYMGPGYGWNDDTEQLMVNAVTWARDAELEPPEAPTLSTAEPMVASSPVTVSGVATGADEVVLTRDGDEVATVEPAEDGAFTAEVELDEGPNTLVAVASNAAGSTESEPLEVTLDTTAPALEWVPADQTAVLDPVVEVSGTATDEHAGVETVTVNGQPVTVAGDGTWSTEVDLAEGENTVTVVATDALGNERTESRTVVYFALDVGWQVPGNGRVVNVRVHVTDAGGNPNQVDEALLSALSGDEVASGPHPMDWRGQRYMHQLRDLPREGEFQLQVDLVIDGYTVTVEGPTINR